MPTRTIPNPKTWTFHTPWNGFFALAWALWFSLLLWAILTRRFHYLQAFSPLLKSYVLFAGVGLAYGWIRDFRRPKGIRPERLRPQPRARKKAPDPGFWLLWIGLVPLLFVLRGSDWMLVYGFGSWILLERPAAPTFFSFHANPEPKSGF